MRYIRVSWEHSFLDEPIEIYSEFDHDRWETRKVEIFRDGSASYASSSRATGSSRLAEVRVRSLEEINSDPQFRAVELTGEEFEEVWERATTQGE